MSIGNYINVEVEVFLNFWTGGWQATALGPPGFVNTILLEAATPIHLSIVCSYFSMMKIDWSSYNRDYITLKEKYLLFGFLQKVY